MSDIKLFRFGDRVATELPGKSALVEKHLQGLIEGQMETFLGIRFIASEYSTGKTHRGRIDSLGLDENGCPVIIEYKRQLNENVINQGLFYLDWLLDHQAEFRWLVMEKLNKKTADKIEWQGTRLLCIATDFTKYDEHAVAQIGRNIELIRYKLFGQDLLLLELVNAVAGNTKPTVPAAVPATPELEDVTTEVAEKGQNKTHTQQLDLAQPVLRDLFEKMEAFILAQGEDIQVKPLKLYVAFKRLKNVATSCVVPKQDARILLWLDLDPKTVSLEDGFTRDVTKVGHWGTGDLEVTIRDAASFEKAKPLIVRCFEES